ncbi:MAG: CRISPR-associated endonuclease Cas2 [Burkholderiaceae bacterium]
MWIAVMFDLPVSLKAERKAATDFRMTLLDLGFEMAQYSVYMRFCGSMTRFETLVGQVQRALPPGGKVNILQFTDKQYERILCFDSGRRQPQMRSPDQYQLF